LHERAKYFDLMKKSPVQKCPQKALHLQQWVALEKYQMEFEFARSLLTSTSREKLDDFNAKVRVLISYGYLDEEMNMLFKGKVAHEIISTDKILTTELIFSGLLKELSIEECIALFSVLYSQVKGSKQALPCASDISDGFKKALNFLCDQTEKLFEVEKRFGVIDTLGFEVDQRLNFYFYELMYGWANKKPFAEVVVENPGIDEGTIVKMVNSVERICVQIKTAARNLEDGALAKKMEEATTLIKRDIIFTPSLYLE
jgi:antiviral helicase SKI2